MNHQASININDTDPLINNMNSNSDESHKAESRESLVLATCRICFGDHTEGKLFSPCKCKGTMGYVHVECLQKWRIEKENSPSYYRCDQCHYSYNLKRVDAAGILKNPCVIEIISVLILFTICGIASFLCYSIFPQYEIIKKAPKINSALQGLIIVGLVSFLCSIFLPKCQRSRPIGNGLCCHLFERNSATTGCHHCPAGIPFEAGASEFVFVIMILVLVYVAVLGVVRAIVFTYDVIHNLAREGAELLETTVLDITDVELSNNLTDIERAQRQIV